MRKDTGNVTKPKAVLITLGFSILHLSVARIRSVSHANGFPWSGKIWFHHLRLPTMAFSGQLSAQSPQSVHLAASITYLSLPSLTAPTGQVSSQVPQEIQSSVILCAIPSFSFVYGYSGSHEAAGYRIHPTSGTFLADFSDSNVCTGLNPITNPKMIPGNILNREL